jgi:hypothetical protein
MQSMRTLLLVYCVAGRSGVCESNMLVEEERTTSMFQPLFALSTNFCGPGTISGTGMFQIGPKGLQG